MLNRYIIKTCRTSSVPRRHQLKSASHLWTVLLFSASVAACSAAESSEPNAPSDGQAGGGGTVGSPDSTVSATGGNAGGLAVPDSGEPGLPDGGSPPPTEELPPFVTIAPEAVWVSACRSDKSRWDGNGSVPDATWQDVVAVAAAPTPSAVLEIFAKWANEGFSAPDLKGVIELEVDGQVLAECPFPELAQDNFTAPFPSECRFEGIPFDGDVRLKIRLLDADLWNDDPIAPFTLAKQDLVEALGSGKAFPVKVAEQTNNEVLFATVSVSAYGGPPYDSSCLASNSCIRPDGDNDGCRDAWEGDGVCDEPSGECPAGSDEQDCGGGAADNNENGCPDSYENDGECDESENACPRGSDGADCDANANGCPDRWEGDGECDETTEACPAGSDPTDCG
jgi:hypothetical protein